MSVWASFRKTWRTCVHQKTCSYSVIIVQIFIKFHESTMKKLLQDNITQTYKRASPAAKRKIDKESSKWFAKHPGTDDRMQCYTDKHAFIALKDHMCNFKNNPKCRLINLSKSKSGDISKVYLNNIISTLARKIWWNKWRNTPQVINWIYPSIWKIFSEELIVMLEA